MSGRPYVPGEKFFAAPGICSNCGESVGLGSSHLHWTGHRVGLWLCAAPISDLQRMAVKVALIQFTVELQTLDAQDRQAACAENGWRMSSTHEIYDDTIGTVIALVSGTLDPEVYLEAQRA